MLTRREFLVAGGATLAGLTGLAVKSGRDEDGWRVGQAAASIVLRECDMTSVKAALCKRARVNGTTLTLPSNV